MLTFVGTALAIGLHIDIGITIRSLADSLGMAQTEELPLAVHPQLVAFLLSKSGQAKPEVCDPVRTYACSWWLQPPMADVELFGPRTITQCLNVHRQEQHVAGVFRHNTARPIPPAVLPAGTDDQYRCNTCILSRHAGAALQSDLTQIEAFADTQMTVAGAKAAMARRTMAGVYCLHEALLQLDPSANTPLQLPHPASLSEAEVVAIAPVAAASIPRIAENMGRIAAASSTSQEVTASVRAKNRHAEDERLDPGDMFGSSPPARPVRVPAAIAAPPADVLLDAGDMFGDTPSISLHVGATSVAAPLADDLLDAGDMFGDSKPASPLLPAAGFAAAGFFDAELDDGESMFGDNNFCEFDGVDIFGTDEEVSDTPDVQMLTADGDRDVAALNMFSEVESQRPSPRIRPRQFTASDFEDLDDILFGPPAGEDEYE